MTDHGSNGAVVHRVVDRGVEIRRLEDAGGEHDLVERRVVVGIDGRRRHPPFGPVHRMAHLSELALLLEFARPQHVLPVRPGAAGLERGVVSPGVGIADLLQHRAELPQRLHLGRVAHPVEPLDPVGQGRLQVIHDLQDVRLRAGGELARHVRLTEGFPHRVVRRGRAPLPAGQRLLHAPQDPLKLEVFIEEGTRQCGRGGVRELPAQVEAPLVERQVGEARAHQPDEGGLGHVERGVARGEGRHAHRCEETAPVDRGGERLQLAHRHLVIHGVRVPLCHEGHRRLGEGGLELQQPSGVASRHCRRRAQ